VLFEGVEPSVAAQAAAAAHLLEPARPVEWLDEEVDARWRELTARPDLEKGVELKITCLPAHLAGVLEAVEEVARRVPGRRHLVGMPASGVLHLGLEGADADAVVAAVNALRERVRRGSVVVREAPPEVKRALDVWGPIGDALPLMRRVKERFDPTRTLNPGRFVGGI
jgi:glycolate oxidase FAD binding subunit